MREGTEARDRAKKSPRRFSPAVPIEQSGCPLAEPDFSVARPGVLFVDDEENVLNGLRRALSVSGDGEWDLHFVSDAREVIPLLNRLAFDLVVTDVCMPFLDGEQLVRYVSRHCLGTEMIVLSGRWGQSETFRRLGPEIGYLTSGNALPIRPRAEIFPRK